jgi:hypothetical protein
MDMVFSQAPKFVGPLMVYADFTNVVWRTLERNLASLVPLH